MGKQAFVADASVVLIFISNREKAILKFHCFFLLLTFVYFLINQPLRAELFL
jgi:type II secretory pathway component PulM